MKEYGIVFLKRALSGRDDFVIDANDYLTGVIIRETHLKFLRLNLLILVLTVNMVNLKSQEKLASGRQLKLTASI